MSERNDLPYISVTSLNTLIKYKLEGEADLRGLYVKGEISNWKTYRSGVFFDLKDENGSVISCLLWGNYASRLSFLPKDGDEVIAFGNITVYAARGRYSLQVFTLELFGLGASLLALENLKKKLAKDGLFDQARKRKIPSMPSTIGIIVGRNSAAESDLRRNILRRWPLTKILFFYAQVQGLDAPKSIIMALNKAEECEIDTLIVARGGGSSEDL
ncbi:MAG TPA: exodeoxyribonuclease VII large subunit, partial [Firmicutes bacterium]|nr:exodeoxyribonuclease VII large subunit [Bacillota bacterium]